MTNDATEYDYVVVGAGSAGAAVAARLSEDPSVSVLLLEAGPAKPHRWTSTPIGFGKVLSDPAYMWHFETQPEPNLNNRRITAMRGKTLGGSSAVNGMAYVRGMPSDYAIWRQMGAESWSYEDVLPFFRKAENHAGGANVFHGAEGGQSVEDARWKNPLADAFISAAVNNGIPRRDDFCQRDIFGVGYFKTTTRNGRRCSTADAYLTPAAGRKNLAVASDATATRIELQGREARGVHYERRGATLLALAKREVILCAGSFKTPHLLELSGIGSGALLQQLGIPVVQDLKGVGENLIDHPLVKRSFATSSPYTFNRVMSNVLAQGLAGIRYLTRHTGPMATGVILAGGFARTHDQVEEPDIQIMFLPFHVAEFEAELPKFSSFEIGIYQNRPASRGSVHAASRDPHESPRIVPNYFSAAPDMQIAVDGLRLIGRISASEPLRKFIDMEISSNLADDGEESLTGFVRATMATSYHHVGTCRMGSADDLGAVVDSRLRVHGVNHLRIADGSVMPAMISSNTAAACTMIGEKCADMIAKRVEHD